MADETTTAAPATETAAEPATPTLEQAAEAIFGKAPEPTAAVEGEAAKPAEPAKEEPKAPAVDERVSKRLEVAKRAEMRAAQARKEIESQKAALAAEREALKPLLEMAEKLKAAKGSPSKLLELAETDPKTFLESLATEHEPAAVAERVAKAGMSEVEKLRAEVEALRKEREEETRQKKMAEVDTTVRQAQQAFLDHVATNATAYPHLAEEYTPDEIASLGLRIAEQHGEAYFAEYGTYPDDEVIAAHLEAQAKARAEARSAWRARVGQGATKPREGATTGVSERSQPESRGQGPRTLTSRAASERATGNKPWSQEWADEESIRILKSRFAG